VARILEGEALQGVLLVLQRYWRLYDLDEQCFLIYPLQVSALSEGLQQYYSEIFDCCDCCNYFDYCIDEDPVQRDYNVFLPVPVYIARLTGLNQTDLNYTKDQENNYEGHPKCQHEKLKYNYSS